MVMKHIALSILATLLLAASTARAGVVTLVLDSPLLSGSPGNVLAFSGTLTNTTSDVVWLISDNFSPLSGLIPAAIDDLPFFTNAPLFLDANESTGDIGLFNVTIPIALTPGNYDGTFTLLGGAGEDSQDILGSADFTVQVVPGAPSSDVPEPGTLPLLCFGACSLLIWGPVMRGIGRCGAR
jgi:hypothetical protein